MYCVRADIEQFFGTVAVGKWADLDGDADATKIAARIAAAIEWAGNEIDATLRGGPYAPIRNKCEKRLAAILSGQLDLGITTTARTVPLVRRVALEDHDITATTLP